jgi:hypothetical protein
MLLELRPLQRELASRLNAARRDPGSAFLLNDPKRDRTLESSATVTDAISIATSATNVNNTAVPGSTAGGAATGGVGMAGVGAGGSATHERKRSGSLSNSVVTPVSLLQQSTLSRRTEDLSDLRSTPPRDVCHAVQLFFGAFRFPFLIGVRSVAVW